MKIPLSLAVPQPRGFTLIELLVVIAIIGLLASIVLASLSNARAKGNDANVKSAMHSVRNAAEQYYLINNGYGTSVGTAGSCGNGSPNGSVMWADSSSRMTLIVADILSRSGNTADCGTNATHWAMAARLPGGTFWCVDSTGAARGAASTTASTYTALTGATGAKLTAGATWCR